jgi:hypothetical protein
MDKEQRGSGHMEWCLRIASMAANELARADLVALAERDRVKEIVAEMIFTRMASNDLPPPGRP